MESSKDTEKSADEDANLEKGADGSGSASAAKDASETTSGNPLSSRADSLDSFGGN